MNNFPLIADKVLQSNLNKTFDHISHLLAISLTPEYKKSPDLVSSLRKTAIIHIASIVEALLLWKIKKLCETTEIKLDNEWKYFDIKVVYNLTNSSEVVAGLRKLETKSLDKLDFSRIIILCCKHGIVRNIELRSNLDKVRVLRNRLHVGGLQEIEKKYTKRDLNFCFSILSQVKRLILK